MTAASLIQGSCGQPQARGGGESRPATAWKGSRTRKLRPIELPSISSYRTTGEDAPAGPRAGSGIETAGVAPGPRETTCTTGPEVFGRSRAGVGFQKRDLPSGPVGESHSASRFKVTDPRTSLPREAV